MEMTKFRGSLKFTPIYGKCDPIIVHGNWELKDIGKPFRVWCDTNLYKGGINENICEILRIDVQMGGKNYV